MTVIYLLTAAALLGGMLCWLVVELYRLRQERDRKLFAEVPKHITVLAISRERELLVLAEAVARVLAAEPDDEKRLRLNRDFIRAKMAATGAALERADAMLAANLGLRVGSDR